MIKKSLICLLLVFGLCFPVIAADDWLFMGKTPEGFEVWMSSDIKPVGYVNEEEQTVILKDIYNFNYKLVGNGQEVLLTGFYDFKTHKVLSSTSNTLKWEDEESADSFLYNAYLLKNYFNIMSKDPFILKNEFVPKDRKDKKSPDVNGWQRVEWDEAGSETWIQVESVVLSQVDENNANDLPKVSVLVKYARSVDGAWIVNYAYVEYDPVSRTKTVLKKWDANKKEIPVEEEEVTEVAILSKDAAVASEAYSVFVMDFSDIEKKGRYDRPDDKLFFPLRWF